MEAIHRKKDCTFCMIYNKKKEGKIVYQDDLIYILVDKKPAGKVHLLTIPIRHIVNISYLSKDDRSLVDYMFQKSKEYIEEKYPDTLDTM
jgi:diadenosine tetraphosphate (Ap4A) HIT family hydrolase